MNGTANISPIDRMGLTLFIAVTFHTVLILGISFTIEPPKKLLPPDRTLEIMVVRNTQPEKKPEKADFLAQTSHEGGGREEKKERPTTELPPLPVPKSLKQTAPMAQPATTPPAPMVKKPEPKKVILKKTPAKKKIAIAPRETPTPPLEKRPTVAQILTGINLEIAHLTAELDRKTHAYAKRPRRKYLNANTREYKYASYLDAWRKKVERIGNLNYPDEAKKRRLYGNLRLHVAIRADGSVDEIRVLKSSGHKLLDDTAIRIVKLAAPFATFPAGIREEFDLLDITRTWQFLNSNRLMAK